MTNKLSVYLTLDLDRGKVVEVSEEGGTTTRRDFASIERLDNGLWYYKPEPGELLDSMQLFIMSNLLEKANEEKWAEAIKQGS